MDSMISVLLRRSENEIILAETLRRLSEDKAAKDFMNVPQAITFYSGVISHSYYAIFYAAKAILLKNNIKTFPPEIHKKTYEAFKKNLADTGVLDIELLKIYKTIAVRAEDLLGIFEREKSKRGRFTYSTIAQANKEPAEDSLRNARIFTTRIIKITEK
jgi:uncharacterized protein (UPF0332 family)